MFNGEKGIVPALLTLACATTLFPAMAQSPVCYTLESLQGSYGVANYYGASVALGLQAETLDGHGNLTRTGILNQPVAGSATGQRTVGTVTSNGTYTVNCNGTGTINRVVTRPDGTTATAVDDFLITAAAEERGLLIATRIVDIQRDPSVILPGGVFLTRVHTRRPSSDRQACYTLDSLQGPYATANFYGDSIAMGIQAETLDGRGNLLRTGPLNQPLAGSSSGERSVGTVTSRGFYTVNCNGTGVMTRIVTRPDGTTAEAADDFLITEAVEKDGRLMATAIIDVQRDPSVILPGGVFLFRTHTLRPRATTQLESQLANLACGPTTSASACQATVNVCNYYLMQRLDPTAKPFVLGDGTTAMTVQQYLDSRAIAGL